MAANTKGTQTTFARAMEKIAVGCAELFGTTILVFVSCMGASRWIVGGDLPSFQSSMAAGMAVTMAIHNFGHISGAHVNPMTTLCAVIMDQISFYMVPIYLVAQLAGSAIGYGLVTVVTPAKHMLPNLNQTDAPNHGIGLNFPSEEITIGQALGVEMLITMVLVFANCSSWDPRTKHLIDSVSIRFGLIVAGLNFAAASYTGASMNPARSFGPALWNNDWRSHWIYWVGPLTSAVVGSLIYRLVFLHRKFTDGPINYS